MKRTDKQRRAIEADSRHIIVSAAAGSGKTSVLTERILRLVGRGADIRSMLVMTFTKAAAAEMRQRITRSLVAAAEGDEGAWLREQAEFVPAADISTFHSFCARVVRENYNLLGILPNFRILGDHETSVRKAEALRTLLNALYDAESPEFRRLLARFSNRADDRAVAAQVLRIHSYIMGRSEPFSWAESFLAQDIDAYIDELKAQYEGMLKKRVFAAQALLYEACEKCKPLADEGEAAHTIAKEELAFAGALLERMEADGVYAALQVYAGQNRGGPPRLSGSAKELVQPLISAAKKEINSVLEDEVYPVFHKQVREECLHTRQDAQAMLDIVRAFDEEYARQKRKKNALDYADLEHFALYSLRQNPDAYERRYPYIFVDEYQDTSQVQEDIVSAIAAQNHLFMVGDMKQSIYRFRMADPEIFKAKLAQYGTDLQHGEVILMNENFRSSSGVIDAVNFLMECLMCEELGGIRYDEGERLIGKLAGGRAEILLCTADDTAPIAMGKDAYQAQVVADSIVQALKEPVTDKSSGKKRPAGYSDVAVLMRSKSAFADELGRALSERGIPFCMNMRGAKEVRELDVIVNLFKTVDNPKDDIALLSVMRSFIGNFDEADFARIRMDQHGQVLFCDAAEGYASAHDDQLSARLQAFLEKLELFRLAAAAMPLAEFVEYSLTRADFETYFACLPDGEYKLGAYRKFEALLAELAENAAGNLYELLLALAEIKKRDESYIGRAEDAGGDGVQIMTIHHSKGLEFPIVYVADMNRKFNERDQRDPFLLHNDFGILPLYIDEKRFIKKETVERDLCRYEIKESNRSEELRMLYVAMTRARERLFLVGFVPPEDIPRYQSMHYGNAKCMFDWVMAANEKHRRIPVQKCLPEVLDAAGPRLAEEQQADQESTPLVLLRAKETAAVPAKVSVSAVKQREGHGLRPFLQAQAGEAEEVSGAALGTLIHTVMERVVPNAKDVEAAIGELLQNHIIDQKEADAAKSYIPMIGQFLDSELNARIKKAQRVIKEQPFNLRVYADEIGFTGREQMLVQGILDLAFMENGKWVLVDYKTDRVSEESMERAAEGYRVQLSLYAKALLDITGIPVMQKYIYFMRIGAAVELG
ncbi:MAG: UvrD-helicase domain-containing protein [Christensenellaceae bacterium]|jgi:ATP-dependent helicase/nuclease subunit A